MPDPGDEHAVDEAVMELLHGHVPLTLLVDLADAPASEDVLREEGLPEQHWWATDQAPEDKAPEDSGSDDSGPDDAPEV